MNNFLTFDVMLKEVRPQQEMDTGASWKFQELTLESEPQEKRWGMIRVQLHITGEPSAVRSRTLSAEVDLGPENTETEAQESLRNS